MRDIVGFILGLVFGSFLNVVIHRLPRGESVVRPRSHCPRCGAALRWFDNIPVLSFIALRAKCRSCAGPIAFRYPFVELLGGAAVLVAIRTWGVSPYGAAGAALLLAFIAVAFIDFEHEIIPDEITLPIVALGPVFSAFFPSWIGARQGIEGFAWSAVGLLFGGGILYLLGTAAEKMLNKEAMGGGDVKFLAGLGSFLGWQGVLLTLFLSSLVGAVFGIILKMLSARERIPYGPFIALGAFIHMFWGNGIISWYLGAVLRY